MIKEGNQSKKRRELQFALCTVILFVLSISFISAVADVAYVKLESTATNEQYLEVLGELGKDYDIIFADEVSSHNLSLYKLMILNNDFFTNWAEIPVNNIPTVVSNGRHMDDWGWTKDVSKGSQDVPSVFHIDNTTEVSQGFSQTIVAYTDKDPDVYYLDSGDVYSGIEIVASNTYDPYDVVVGLAHAGTNLARSPYPNTEIKSNACFFGIYDSKYWTNDSKELFKQCVLFAMIDCASDNDCPADSTGDLFCQEGNLVQNFNSFSCVNPGQQDAQCQATNTITDIIENCGSDSYSSYGANHCKDGDVYKNRTFYDKGCSEDGEAHCFNTGTIEYQPVQDCDDELQTCSEGQCIDTPIECTLDSDCGEEGWLNQERCTGKDVYDLWITPTCNDKGLPSSSCSNFSELRLKEPCSNFCTDGECVGCIQDSDCPLPFFSNLYCSNLDLFKNLTSYSCEEFECVSEITHVYNETCNEACSDGECQNITCFKNSDCGVNDFIEPLYCSPLGLFSVKDFKSFICHNEGQITSSCSNNTLPIFLEFCPAGCDDLTGLCREDCQTEECNGLDDDCDTLIDEDFLNLGTSCTAGIGACEAQGSYTCTSDGTGTQCSAIPLSPSTEICTGGLDEDCDGFTDCDDFDCSTDQACITAECGNNITETGEECDDGNQDNGDGCSSTCTITTQCSDSVDNDGDILIDFPNDPGCTNSSDDDETDCQTNSDCNHLDNNYCSSDFVSHDEGICVNSTCQTNTSSIEDCSLLNGLNGCGIMAWGCIEQSDQAECVITDITPNDVLCQNQCDGSLREFDGICNTTTYQCDYQIEDCSLNNILEIATCNNNPDDNPFTWDFLPGFTSQCEESTDSCTIGPENLLISSCDVGCGAECSYDSDCDDTSCSDLSGCNGSNWEEYGPDVENDCNDCACESNSCESPTVYINDSRCVTPQCTEDSDCGEQVIQQYCNVYNNSVLKIITPECLPEGVCQNSTDITRTNCTEGCMDGFCLEESCKSFLNVDITGFENITLTSPNGDMSDFVFVGNNTTTAFKQSPAKIPLGIDGVQLSDFSTDFKYSLVPGLSIFRGEDGNGTYVYISAAGFNHNLSREAVNASFEFENASTSYVYNGLYPSGKRPFDGNISDGICSRTKSNDEYSFPIAGTTGDICSITSSGEDRIKVYYQDSCLPFRCGDGDVEGDEDCDDGNLDNGDGCSFSCLIEEQPQCEASVTVDITYFANYTAPGADNDSDMSDYIFVGNDTTTPFGQSPQTILLEIGGVPQLDTASNFKYSSVPGLSIFRDQDENGTFIYISAAGFNSKLSREYVKADFEFENALIFSAHNGLPNGKRPFEQESDGLCSINETDPSIILPGWDDYFFPIGTTAGNICSMTSGGEDRVKVYYTSTCEE
jgi:cysteine-rich repeat protein